MKSLIHLSFILFFNSTILKGQTNLTGHYNTESQTFIPTDTAFHCDIFQEHIGRIYKNGYVGLINTDGKILLEPAYDCIFPFERNNITTIALNGYFGLINKQGNVLYHPRAEEIKIFNDSFIGFKDAKSRWGVLNGKGNVIVSPKYYNIRYLENHLFMFITDNGKKGLINSKGEVLFILPNMSYPNPLKSIHNKMVLEHLGNSTELFTFKDGLTAVPKVDSSGIFKFGCINTSGVWVIPATYDWIGTFENNMAPVKMAGRWGLINARGKSKIPCMYDSLILSPDNTCIVQKDSLFGVVDTNNQTVIPIEYSNIQALKDGRYIVAKKDRFGLISSKNKPITRLIYPNMFHLFKDLFMVRYPDTMRRTIPDIKIVENTRFDMALLLNRRMGSGQWAVINSKEKEIVPAMCDGIARLNDSVGYASRHRYSTPLNTGIPRYVYHGDCIYFSDTGIIQGKGFSFSQTMQGLSDYYYPSSTPWETSFFLPRFAHLNWETYDSGHAIIVEHSLKNGYLLANKKGKLGVINKMGEIIIPFEYNSIHVNGLYPTSYENGPCNLLVVSKERKQGVINLNNEVVVDFDYHHPQIFPGIILVSKQVDGKSIYKVVDFKGKTLIPYIKDPISNTEIRASNDGSLWLKENWRPIDGSFRRPQYMIDKKGNRLYH